MFDRCLYFNTNHLSRVVGKIWTDAYSELGLAPAHAYLLRLVLGKPNLTQKEIGEALHLEKSTITRFIDKMVEEGYVVRKSNDSGNSKNIEIIPTIKAKKIKTRLNSIGDELYEKLTKEVGGKELKQLVGLLRLASKEL